jgi:DNA-binding NarL/FixJ family response regulator
MMQKEKIFVALVDDHVLLRGALANLINTFDQCEVVIQSDNGVQFFEHLKINKMPNVVLLDLNMPLMDGFETASLLQSKYPQIGILMLTMYDSELSLIRLLQMGVKGFLKKDVHPEELKYALHSVTEAGYYYSTKTAGKLANLFRSDKKDHSRLQQAMLTDQEVEFLKLACSDRTYKEIAQEMSLTPRTVDILRDGLFFKLDVRSRVGLAMVALRNGVVTH